MKLQLPKIGDIWQATFDKGSLKYTIMKHLKDKIEYTYYYDYNITKSTTYSLTSFWSHNPFFFHHLINSNKRKIN